MNIVNQMNIDATSETKILRVIWIKDSHMHFKKHPIKLYKINIGTLCWYYVDGG